MATAKRRERTEARTTLVNVVDGVTLELNDAEARTLAALMAHIGGCPATSARHYTTNIDRALTTAGYDTNDRTDMLKGAGVHFKDGTKVEVEIPL